MKKRKRFAQRVFRAMAAAVIAGSSFLQAGTELAPLTANAGQQLG